MLSCSPELLTLAVAQVLLGVRSETRWLRFVPAHLPGAFPYLPGQSGYNKRLRAAVPLLKRAIRAVAADTDLWTDTTWVVDSTPVECGRSRPTVKRSDLAGWAGYGYCASHSRWFWGLRLHLVCTPADTLFNDARSYAKDMPYNWSRDKSYASIARAEIAARKKILFGRAGWWRAAERGPDLGDGVEDDAFR